MTVKELADALSAFPGELRVIIHGDLDHKLMRGDIDNPIFWPERIFLMEDDDGTTGDEVVIEGLELMKRDRQLHLEHADGSTILRAKRKL